MPYLVRSNRQSWLRGQCIYIVIMIALYNVVMLLSCFLVLREHTSLSNTWSSLFVWSTRQFEISGAFDFSSESVRYLMSTWTPYLAGIFTFLWNMMWMCAFSMLYIALSLISRKAAMFGMGVIFLTDLMIRQSIGSESLFYVSPLTWGRWLFYQSLQTAPPLVYGICGFTVIIFVFYIVTCRLLPEFDFSL